MMKIRINGEPAELPEPYHLIDALAYLGLDLPARSAVAHNGQVIPRATLAEVELHEGDELLLIRPTFGG